MRLSYGSVWGEARAVVAAVGVELLDSARDEVVRVRALVPLGGLGDDQQRPRGQAARELRRPRIDVVHDLHTLLSILRLGAHMHAVTGWVHVEA